MLLDLDGTLAPIVERPQDVQIPDEISRLLPVLSARYGLLAFISGREITELRRIVGVREAAYSGNHGLEIRLKEGRGLPVPQAGVGNAALRDFADRWTPDVLGDWGVWLEDKGATLTFHYRTAPDPDLAAARLGEHVAPAAAAEGLLAEPGRMSLEVHPEGSVNKGTAVRALLDEYPKVRRAVSLGDDRTDVTIWHEFRGLVDAGRLDTAIAIGVRSDETPPEVLAEADILVDGVYGSMTVLSHLAAGDDVGQLDPSRPAWGRGHYVD